MHCVFNVKYIYHLILKFLHLKDICNFITTSLSALRLVKNLEVEYGIEVYNDELFAWIRSHCIQLTSIRLPFILLSDDKLLALASQSPNLRTVKGSLEGPLSGDLNGNWGYLVSKEGFDSFLKVCPNLREWHPSLTSDMYSALSKHCPLLEEIFLCCNHGDDDDGNRVISRLSLEGLVNNCAHLKTLFIDNICKISDDDVALIGRKLQRLKILNLSNFNLSPGFINRLKMCDCLQFLSIEIQKVNVMIS